ncbi:ABC transporter substrate-binding protein [Clostridium sp. Marseille-P2415]|uniref:ABC transporter substrate-binding protein n=1 Tax=Clostridium sp. Marseille-P2415 TaxID=1805471 RepID=UPI00098873A7|nr:extracellular solute-binding protein [Clostridium sp. Marseille-P2415]
MKKQWRGVLSLVTAAAVTVSLAACGSSAGTGDGKGTGGGSSVQSEDAAGESTTGKDSAESGEPVTLRFAWWGGDSRHEATLKAIGLYEEKHPNVKIEGEYQGYDGYYEKMMTTLSSGTAPDIFQFSRDWIADVQEAKHYIADLSKLPVDLTTLKKNTIEKSGMYNGEPVMFPCTVGGQVLYVNTDFASRFGVDMAKQYTWDELKELGRKVHEQDPEAYLMTADIDVLNRLIALGYIAQQTGDSLVNQETYELNFTEQQMASSLQNILDLYESNTLEPFGEAAVFVGQMDQNNKWVNGKIGMLLDNTGSCPKYEASTSSKIDVMKIPVMENAVSSGVDFSSNMGFCINDNSKNKEEAAKFLDFIQNDPEAIEILRTERGYCPTDIAEKTLEEKGLLNQTQKRAVALAQPDSYTINTISGNTELETIRKDVIQEVIYGDITPEEGAKEIVDQYKEVLSSLKSEK